MSYNDQYNEGGSRQGYGGGNNTYGGNQGGDEGGYGEERRHGGNDNYGRNQGGYGGEERRHGGNQEERYGSGGNFGVTGGPEYNTGGGAGYGNQSGGGYNNQSQSGGYPSGPQGHQNQGGHESGESSLFSSALGFLSNNKQNIASSAPDFDESQATNAHQAVYGKGDNQQHDSQTLGMSAAIQAMQKFTGGGAPQPPPQKEEGGLGGLVSGFLGKEKHEQPPPQQSGLTGMISSVMGGDQGSQGGQNQFIAMAMKEASELFNKQEAQGNVVSAYFSFTLLTMKLPAEFPSKFADVDGSGSRYRQTIRRQFRGRDGNEVLHEAADGLLWRLGRHGFEVHVGHPSPAPTAIDTWELGCRRIKL